MAPAILACSALGGARRLPASVSRMKMVKSARNICVGGPDGKRLSPGPQICNTRSVCMVLHRPIDTLPSVANSLRPGVVTQCFVPI